MKRVLSCVILFCTIICVCAYKPLKGHAAQEQNNELVYSYSVNEENSPGYFPEDEREELAPNAFCISGNTVLMDDSRCNHRILVYDDQVFRKSIELAYNVEVLQMYYDDSCDVLKLVYRIPYNDGSRLYLGNMCIETEDMESVELSNAEKILLEYCFDQAGNLLTTYLTEENDGDRLVWESEIAPASDEELYKVESEIMLTRGNGNVYKEYFTYTLYENGSIIHECILKENEDGSNSYAIPQMHEHVLQRGDIQITPEGTIYQMVVNENGLKIYRLQEYSGEFPDTEDMLEREYHWDNIPASQSTNAGYVEMTTVTIRERLDTYKNLQWTFNSNRNANFSVTGDSGKVTQPLWLETLSDGRDHTVTGVPYCWGGWNAESFISEINKGKFAGNINTSSSGYISGTVGMDCSGYVSVGYNLPYKHGTATLSDCFQQLDGKNPQAFDILNKPDNHVIIIYKTYLNNGTRYVNTYEESTGEGGISYRLGLKYDDFVGDGYIPMRYMYLK